jgi:alkylation response protein AidB-like acyl-CoA dehydrogenase
MNFDFSEDEKQLREEAQRFLRDQCPLSRVRAVLESGADHDAALWRSIVELGWTSAIIPEAYGGLGMSHLDLCMLAEELGRALAPLPTVPSIYVVTNALIQFGSEAQKRQWLPRLASGDVIGTLAWAEGGGVPSGRDLATLAQGGTVTGRKTPVPAGMIAHLAIVVTRSGAGTELQLVDLGGAGVTRSRIESIDPTRGHASLTFDGAPAERLGGSDGMSLLETTLQRAAVPTAFEQVAGAEATLEMARTYALERYAFGRPIGSFQAVKHKLADMFVANVLARSNAYYAAWALSSDAADLPIAAACARVSACKAFDHAAQENIQVHGGSGFTWGLDCHLYYRRARELSLVLGSPRGWKERIISGLENVATNGAKALESSL